MGKTEAEPAGLQTSPVYWMAVLEEAIQAGDLDRAAEAQAKLRRLGVRVTYRLRRVSDPHPAARKRTPA